MAQSVAADLGDFGLVVAPQVRPQTSGSART